MYSTIQKREEKKADKRIEASIAYRKEKIANSKFKVFTRWFYFGNGWSRDENKKRYFDYTKVYYPPYKKLLWRKLWSWQKKTEKKGVVIKRPYYHNGETEYQLYRYHNPKSITLKGRFEDFKQKFDYHPSICTFDFFDVDQYWINKLTIMGVKMYLTGNTTTAKYHAHEMWTARKMLLNAFEYEDKKSYEFDLKFKDTYGVEYELSFLSADKEKYIQYKEIGLKAGVSLNLLPIKSAENYVSLNFPDLKDIEFRKKAYEIALVMDEFICENHTSADNQIEVAKEQKRLTKKAFDYIATHYTGWWD